MGKPPFAWTGKEECTVDCWLFVYIRFIHTHIKLCGVCHWVFSGHTQCLPHPHRQSLCVYCQIKSRGSAQLTSWLIVCLFCALLANPFPQSVSVVLVSVTPIWGTQRLMEKHYHGWAFICCHHKSSLYSWVSTFTCSRSLWPQTVLTKQLKL
jgi:hypothetical protein